MHEELVEYELPPNNNKSVVNGNLSIEYSPNSHVGDKYYIYGPVTYLHPNGEEEKKINSTPYILDAATLKEGLQSQGNTHNDDSTVCIVDERKFKIRRLHILIAACLLVLITTATLLTVFLGTGNSSDIDSDENIPLRIIKRAEWNAENSTSPIENLKVLPPRYVIVAHTVSQECNTTDECKSLVRSIQAFHISLGFGDIGYNFLVGGDGNIYEGLGWDKYGAHTISFNSRSIGLAFIGNFMEKEPPRRQIMAAQLLLEKGVIIKKLDANYKVFGHRQVLATDSPGTKLMHLIETTWAHWAPYDPNIDD